MSDTDPPPADPASSTWIGRIRSVFDPEPSSGSPGSQNAPDPHHTAASRARQVNAERFETLRVDDVMVPRADIKAVEADTTLGEVTAIFADVAHSRMPVYRESLDEPIGMVHIKDVVRLIEPRRKNGHDIMQDRVLPSIARQLLYVPPSMRAADLLLKMQTRRIHMALVVDEFGGTDGLVTLEDLVEEIVGDIVDEHEETNDPVVRARSARCWEADARAPVEALEDRLDLKLAPEDPSEEVDTLGGLVFMLAGRVPERGEVIAHPAGVEFEVEDADARRIKRLVIRLLDAPAEDSTQDAGPNTQPATGARGEPGATATGGERREQSASGPDGSDV